MGLTVHDISKSFGKNVVLSHFSYIFPDTGCYAILAPSGKGKTTLLRILAGLDTAHTGTHTRLDRVSVLFQEHRLFENINVIQNVLLAEGTVADTKELLSQFGFTREQMDLFPNELSGGMKQRVALCRAFLSSAPVLLLDEPCKELDEKLTDSVCQKIAMEAKKRLVILTVHTEEEAARCQAQIIRL